MINRNLILTVLSFLMLAPAILLGQGQTYEGPDDPASDPAMRREGWMSGNRVFLYFRNTTELSNCCGTQWSKWPNNPDGLPITDGVALLIGARVFVDAATDSIPVTSPGQISNGVGLDTLYYLQTSYREETDFDPQGTVEWGFNPVKGYFNIDDEYIAMSHLPNSWPPDGWPARGFEKKWPGEWNGRFGRGVIYADQETYFVANDAQDLENIYKDPSDPNSAEKPVYYPRPGVFIGDIDNEVTTQRGKPWGGLGLRVEVRSFQWNNVQARDNVFFEYNIANISDYDLPQIAFGYWVDNGIGGNWPYDDLGYFDTYEDMSYSWDKDGIGDGGRITGVFGFAYLESPGASYDLVDNDEDGLVDEKRDNDAGTVIGPEDGIANIDNFLKFYGLKREELKSHWSGDEDQDWEDGQDLNNNGIYDQDEFPGDDVGLDGVGPLDLNYTGPDEGEANHKPDFIEGVGSEPNFAFTDISESDMIGLTTFQLFPVPPHNPPFHNWFRNDYDLWVKLASDSLEEYDGHTANLVEFFASGIFPLYQGRTERISMSLLHSYDPIEGLNASNHSAPALYVQKQIVQAIYETDYRFAQPPEMPTLKAIQMDGKVALTWDDRSDTKTHDPFVRYENDFEGYKLYRSTDLYFSDAQQITDGFGTASILKPVFQCDKIDQYSGFADWGEINGQGFYLGSNSGIKHYFVDENIQNGRTYYYGLAAYDYGISDFGDNGISPSENNLVIDLDEYGNIRDLGQNIAVATPRTEAAGYVLPSIELIGTNEPAVRGTEFNINLLDKDAFASFKDYKIEFGVDTIGHYQNSSSLQSPYDIKYLANQIYIYDVTDGKNDLVYEETPEKFPMTNIVEEGGNQIFNRLGVNTEVFDGLQISFDPVYDSVRVDLANSGWLVGDKSVEIEVNDQMKQYFPWEYDFVFFGTEKKYKSKTTGRFGITDVNGSPLTVQDLIFGESVELTCINRSFTDSTGANDTLDVIAWDVNDDGVYNMADDMLIVGTYVKQSATSYRWTGTLFQVKFAVPDEIPANNDVYRIQFTRPFGINDSLMFRVKAGKNLETKTIKGEMDKIQVVPNPYVAGNKMEPATTLVNSEQQRRIMFTHIPADCTIKIFTVSGVLVDQINVDNPPSNGAVHWDLTTRENLEIAAGVYVYQVKSNVTGDEKIGKFAVIK